MEENLSRRSFLKKAVGIVVGLTAASSAAPIVRYLIPKLSKEGDNILTNADGEPMNEKDIAEGSSFVGSSAFGPTIVVRNAGKLIAYSAVCTHLGCLVKWQQNDDTFLCPCHAGRYDINGKNISGPPPAPLPKYSVTIDASGHILLGKV